MINQRIKTDVNYATTDFTFVDWNIDGDGLKDPKSWEGLDYDFVVRTAGGGRKITGNHLGAVWLKEDKPDLNMGITPVKAHVEGVFERFQQIVPDEIMWFTLHPFMSRKDILEWYCKKYNRGSQ